MGPGTLQKVLDRLPSFKCPSLLVGPETGDDAGVFKIDDNLALVQTLDFFTPVVDDPYTFGAIAAANSLSDVYAMGGEPLTVMNIVGFPSCTLPIEVLGEILRGGADKIKESGAILVGGHTVEDKEPKYGLSVTGRVHPERVITNSGAQAGDYLILTKSLGVGIVVTSIKGGLATSETTQEAINQMAFLNKQACEVMIHFGVKGATDVTGFGLIGHAVEMAKASKVSIELYPNKLPLITGAIELARMGMIPAGAYQNREYFSALVEGSPKEEIMDVLYDPQTSGGILMAVTEDKVEAVLQELHQTGVSMSTVVGKVLPKGEKEIYLREE